MRTCLLVLVTLLCAACAVDGLPARQADMNGVVTSVGAGTRTILVEESRDPNTGSKASVTIDDSTRIWTVNGKTVTRVASDALRVGVSVRVWFNGPVATSYPVQGRAADIAIGAASGAPVPDTR